MNKPNNTQIELVEGCNRMCEFCGIHGIWKRKEDRIIKFMPLELAYALAKDFGRFFEKKRIEFAMHGEPLLHPNVVDIIKAFRKECPKCQLQLTTNGLKLIKGDLIKKLFDAGLNILNVDTYVKEGEIRASFAKVPNVEVVNFHETNFNCYYYYNHTLQKIVVMGDLAKNNAVKKQRVILNHAGNVEPEFAEKFGAKILTAPLTKKCSRVYREMVVHYDGTVPLCCIDWKHEFIVGKFPDDGSLEEIWNSEIFNIMRYFLGKGERYFTPCWKCDYNGGFRLGLLNLVKLKTNESTLRSVVKAHVAAYRAYAHRNADPKLHYNKGAEGISKFVMGGSTPLTKNKL